VNRTFAQLVICFLLLRTGISEAQTTNTPDIYDGFETPALSKSWSAGRFESGAVEMQTNIFRAGHGAVKITVQAGQKFEPGANGNTDSERAELMEAPKLVSKENAACEYSFSMFIPTNFPVVPTRLVIAQWKQYCPAGAGCSDDSPVLAVRYISGELIITQDLDKKYIELYRKKDEFRGRWLDFRFQVRFATNETGRVKAWLDGKQLVDHKGVTADAEGAGTGYSSPGHFYFKMGLYRNVMPEPWTIYIDEYRKKQLPDGEF
jgi:hypothetical protein